MASLNDDLKARKHSEIAPTTFVQEVVRIILLASNKQISVEEARLKSIALMHPPNSLRAISTNSGSETLDRQLGPPHFLYTAPGAQLPPQIKSDIGAATDIRSYANGSLNPQPLAQEKHTDQDTGVNTRDTRNQEGNDQSETEEDREMKKFQNMVKEEQIDRNAAFRTPGPMPKKHVDDKNELQESKEPPILGPSLVACERCIKSGRQCLAFNTTRRSVCSNCRKRRVRCSNSRKSMKQAAMEGNNGDHKPQPEAKPKLRRTVGPRRKTLSRRVDELEQVIEELRAEFVKQERNERLEDAILTMSNFVHQHTASADARLQIEQATAERIHTLEERLLVAGIPIHPLVPDAGTTSTNDSPPMSSKSIFSLPSTSTDPWAGVRLLPLHHVHGRRKRIGSEPEVLNIPKRARSE